jgi:hypothetical protein
MPRLPPVTIADLPLMPKSITSPPLDSAYDDIHEKARHAQ